MAVYAQVVTKWHGRLVSQVEKEMDAPLNSYVDYDKLTHCLGP